MGESLRDGEYLLGDEEFLSGDIETRLGDLDLRKRGGDGLLEYERLQNKNCSQKR